MNVVPQGEDAWVAMVLLIGFGLGFLVYDRFKVQIGGVIATPLLVIYVLSSPGSIIIFLIATISVFLLIEFLVEYTLMYGRRLYYLGAIVSIIVTYSLRGVFNIPQPAYFSVIPAIIGYNLYRESEIVSKLRRSIIVWGAEFGAVLVAGYALGMLMRGG